MDTAIKDIMEIVCKVSEIDIKKVMGTGRQRELVTVRKIVAAILRNHFGLTHYQIGAGLRKDHSNIVHYLKNHGHNMIHDIEYKYTYNTSLIAIKGENIEEIKKDLNAVEANNLVIKRNQFLEDRIKLLHERLEEVKSIIDAISLNDKLKY